MEAIFFPSSKENGATPSSSSSAANSSSEGGGSGGSSGGSSGKLAARLTAARRVHHEVCSLLLGAYESLQYAVLEFSSLMPEVERPRVDMANCAKRLENLSDMAKVSERGCPRMLIGSRTLQGPFL